MAWTTLCELNELEEGRGKYVEIGGFQLAVVLSQGQVYVTDNVCPHAGGNLSEGHVDNGCLVCPWHSWPFELTTGKLRGAPGVAITTYKTRTIQPQGKPLLIQADLPIF